MEQSLENQKEKRDLLIFFYDKTREESAFLRERQYKIFTWTSSLLIGLLLVTDSAKNFSFNINNPVATYHTRNSFSSHNWVCFFLSIGNNVIEDGLVKMVLLLTKSKNCFIALIKDISILAMKWHYFLSHGGFQLPPITKKFQRLFYANYISATIFLGLMTILMVWVCNPWILKVYGWKQPCVVVNF